MNKTSLALFGCFMPLFLSGCLSSQPMAARYKPGSQLCVAPKVERMLVGMPKEARPGGGQSRIGIGFLTVIPGVPFAAQKITPEIGFFAAGGVLPPGTSPMFKYDFKRDLGELIVSDLKAAGIAREIRLVSDYSSMQKHAGDVYLDVKLQQGVWSRNITTYGCSIFGSLLWMVGAPPSYGHVDLGLQVEVIDVLGKVHNTATYSAESAVTESMHKNKLPRSLCLAYGEISPQLRAFVVQNSEGARDVNGPAHGADSAGHAKVDRPMQSVPETARSSDDIPARLKTLVELKQSGFLTEAEYQAKRRTLVDQL